jgi:hypothetical protein
MAFHLALYHASLAGNAALTQLNALGDQLIAPAANGYLVNEAFPRIFRAAGVGALLMRSQLSSGTIRDHAPFDLAPPNVGTAIAIPPRRQEWLDNPLKLKPNEELDCFILNSGAGPTRTTVAVWFCDGPIRPVTGDRFTMRWTNAVAAVAFQWTAFQPVFDNGLPSGVFAVVGSRLQSATSLFHRFLPRGGSANARPGTFSGQADGDAQDTPDRNGAIGEWLRFTTTTQPQIENFCLAADATSSGEIDLIQVA